MLRGDILKRSIIWGQTHRTVVWVFLFAVLIAFSLGIRLLPLKEWHKYSAFYYQGQPLPTTVDAYYYLRLARDLAKDNYRFEDPRIPTGRNPWPPPLPSVLTAVVHKVTGIPLRKIAFFLPCVLALFMVLPYFLWSRELSGTFFFFSSAATGMSAFYWYFRTSLGRFDTDCLLPFFTFMIPFTAYSFLRSPISGKLFWGGVFLTLAILFSWWWQFGLILSLGLFFVPYGLSVFFYRQKKIDNYFRFAVLILLAVCTAALLLPTDHLPHPVASLILKTKAHLRLIFHHQSQQLPEVGISIGELSRKDPGTLLKKLCGYPWLIVVALAGVPFLLKRRRLPLFFLICPSFLGLLSFWSVRFLLFLIPLYAFLISATATSLLSLPKRRVPRAASRGLAVALLFLVLVVQSKSCLSVIFPPPQRYCEVVLAKRAYQEAQKWAKRLHLPPENIVFWNWWDYGYMLEYFIPAKIFIDNGSQDPLRIFITSVALSTSDEVFLSRWLNYFSSYGPEGFLRLNRFNSPQKTFNLLKELFSLRDKKKLREKLSSMSLKMESFLPREGKIVVLYLPFQMFKTAYWWYYYGTWNFEQKRGKHPEVFFLRENFSLDKKEGIVEINGKSIPLKGFLGFSLKDNYLILERKFFPHNSGYYFFEKAYGRMSFLFDENLFQSSLVQTVLRIEDPRVKVYPFCGAFRLFLFRP